ncbi:hypothetical protein KJ807_05565 [Patescibacteria group bacterium]|nr:hypothetical protein [Patescibacteria group bacterium]
MEPVEIALIGGAVVAGFYFLHGKQNKKRKVTDGENQARISGVNLRKTRAVRAALLEEGHDPKEGPMHFEDIAQYAAHMDERALTHDWERPNWRVAHKKRAFIHQPERRYNVKSGTLDLASARSWVPVN